jgi:hypothetical protein
LLLYNNQKRELSQYLSIIYIFFLSCLQLCQRLNVGVSSCQQNVASFLMGEKVTNVLDPCCQQHDNDYCDPVRRMDQKLADLKFRKCMIAKCNGALDLDPKFPANRCLSLAHSTFWIVDNFGKTAYDKCAPDLENV